MFRAWLLAAMQLGPVLASIANPPKFDRFPDYKLVRGNDESTIKINLKCDYWLSAGMGGSPIHTYMYTNACIDIHPYVHICIYKCRQICMSKTSVAF